MKKFTVIFLSVCFLAFSYVTVSAQNKTNDIVIKIDGMTCIACVETMQKVFKKENSVDTVEVSLENQTITINTKEGQDISDEKIKELIEWGGYDFVSITRLE